MTDWAMIPVEDWMLSTRELATKYGCGERNVRKMRAKHAPSFPQAVIPDGHQVVGVSTYVNNQWIKTRGEKRSGIIDAVKKLCEGIQPFEAPSLTDEVSLRVNTIDVMPLGDPHIGMLSWGRETGQKWDLTEAKRVYISRLARLMRPGKRLLMVGLGDNLHANSKKALTPHSGHLLDVDSRFANAEFTALTIFVRAIQNALTKYENVDVILLSGNHDPDASLSLAMALASGFRNEPRVRVDLRVSKFRYYVWGRCLFGFAHGDTRKMTAMSGVMLNEWPDLCGSASWRQWYTGHVHHETRVTLDDGSMAMSLETLAARDAYASEGGWSTRRSALVQTWDYDLGLVAERSTRISHHRSNRLAPVQDFVGWREEDGLQLSQIWE